MSGVEQHMGLSPREDLIWYAAWRRGALCVSGGGGETPVVVSRVLGDVGVSSTADILRRGQVCEPTVRGVSVVGGRLVSSEVGESYSMDSPGVMGCVHVSAMSITRSGALWRAPPPLTVLRMAAWMSSHATLWRLMRKASWSKHSPAIWVHESGM